MKAPLIGVPCVTVTSNSQPARFGNNQAYMRAIEEAGGVPVLIPLLRDEEALRAIYQRLSGLLLTGGVDVDPAHYGEEPIQDLGSVDPELDRVEMCLINWAMADDLPILGICRGQQMLNVALGGSLYQDIPSQVRSPIDHLASKKERPSLAHDIEIERSSRLADILGSSHVRVNSIHHQAVKRVAPSLRATAQSDDGLCEALESPSHRFVLSVQCHPEELFPQHDWAKELFRVFVGGCGGTG